MSALRLTVHISKVARKALIAAILPLPLLLPSDYVIRSGPRVIYLFTLYPPFSYLPSAYLPTPLPYPQPSHSVLPPSPLASSSFLRFIYIYTVCIVYTLPPSNLLLYSTSKFFSFTYMMHVYSSISLSFSLLFLVVLFRFSQTTSASAPSFSSLSLLYSYSSFLFISPHSLTFLPSSAAAFPHPFYAVSTPVSLSIIVYTLLHTTIYIKSSASLSLSHSL